MVSPPRQSRTVRSALRAAVVEARAAGRLTAELEVSALLADRVAAAVDRAARAEDDRVMLAAAGRLGELMGRLPLRDAPVGGVSGGGDGGRGEFLRVVGGDAEVGDASDG